MSTGVEEVPELPHSSARHLLRPLQVAKIAPDVAKDTSSGAASDNVGDPAESDATYSGEGSTCTALAPFFNRSGIFSDSDSDDDNVQVCHDNLDVPDGPSQLRTIDQIIETQPAGDAVANVAEYRTAVKGCPAALVGDDGSRLRVRLLPRPRVWAAAVSRCGSRSPGVARHSTPSSSQGPRERMWSRSSSAGSD